MSGLQHSKPVTSQLMQAGYARFYECWTIVSFLLEMFVPITYTVRLFQVLALATVELIGVFARSQHGDTYSEYLRALTYDADGDPMWARLAAVGVLAQYIAYIGWDVSPGTMGAGILLAGFDAWLTIHWLTGGKEG